MAYKVADRAKEWTTYAGTAIAAAAVAIPQMVPPHAWVTDWGAAQLLLGAALVFLPQAAGSTAVENDALVLLQALSEKLPPQYSLAMQPFMAMLAKASLQPTPRGLPSVVIPPPVAEPAAKIVVAEPVAEPAAKVVVAEPALPPGAVASIPTPPQTYSL